MYNTFLLSYDPLMQNPTPDKLLQFVRSNVTTYQYLTPFVGSIFIKSQASLELLISSYNPFISPHSFTLIQIYPTLSTGLLPPAFWDWINAQTPPPLPGI